MKWIVAIVAFCYSTTGIAEANGPAWERASKYLCRADKVRVCERHSESCSLQPGAAVFEIDFAAGKFRVFGSEPRFTETITFKRFKPFGSVPDIHFFSLDGGARVMTFGRPDNDVLNPNTIPATFTDTDSSGSVVIHYMRCQAQ